MVVGPKGPKPERPTPTITFLSIPELGPDADEFCMHIDIIPPEAHTLCMTTPHKAMTITIATINPNGTEVDRDTYQWSRSQSAYRVPGWGYAKDGWTLCRLLEQHMISGFTCKVVD